VSPIQAQTYAFMTGEVEGGPTCKALRGVSFYVVARNQRTPIFANSVNNVDSGFNSEFTFVVENATCEELSAVVKQFDADEPVCASTQATFGTYCGCSNAVSSEGFCRICGDDRLLPDSNAIAGTDEDGEPLLCISAERNDEELDCDELQAKYADKCCGEGETSTSEGETSTNCGEGESGTNGGEDGNENSSTETSDAFLANGMAKLLGASLMVL